MIDSWIRFHFILPPLLTVGLLVILATVLIWKEAQRKQKFPLLRIIVQLIMLAALAGILFRPSYRTSTTTTIMLLTPDYNVRQADSILKANPPLKIFHTNNTQPYNGSEQFSSVNALTKYGNSIRYILGEGLPAYEIEFLNNQDVTFLPTEYPTGIVQLNSPGSAVLNRKNKIEGVLYNAPNNAVLYLEGPGGKEDSLPIPSKKIFPFTLHFIPKQAGQFIYQVQFKDGAGHAEKHSIPINVQQPKTLNILIVQRYPTFETQYLKSFLSAHHQLLLRYELSRNTYRYEYINRAEHRIERLHKENLSAFDLLIIDSDALKSLSSSELSALQQAVQQGLGIFFLFNENPSNIRVLKPFLPFNFKKFSQDTVRFKIESKTISLPTWPVNPDAAPSLYRSIESKQRMVAGYTFNGMGRAGFHLAQETFSLYLQGDSLSYSSFWADVLEPVARHDEKIYSLHIRNVSPIYPDQPISVEMMGTQEPPTLFMNNINVPVLEDITMDGVWHATVWASEPGWHTLHIKEDSTTLKIYVAHGNESSSLAKANMINATKSVKGSKKISEEAMYYFKPISPLFFYITLLLSAGFIWIVPKL